MRFYQKLYVHVAVDMLLVWFSIHLSYYFRFVGDIPELYFRQLLVYGTVSSVLVVLCMYRFRLYQHHWQYASVQDLQSILLAVLAGNTLSVLLTWTFVGYTVPISVWLLSFETLLLLVGGVRLLWRFFFEMLRRDRNLRKGPTALIVGAGSCGSLVVKELLRSGSVTPIAFIDDDPSKHKLKIAGIPVIGGRERIPSAVQEYGVRDIILALPSASRNELLPIIDLCRQTSARLKTVPSLQDLIDGRVTVNSIRNVAIEDLLRRPPAILDTMGVQSYLNDRVILVTGAGGSIGSELCRQICRFRPRSLILLGHGENSIYEISKELGRLRLPFPIETVIADVKDRARLERAFARYRPHVVFHAAAYKHVPLMEANPAEAVENNVFGTKNVAECADAYGAERFVLISSDKAVNPSSIMGATKRVAEMIVQGLASQSRTVFSSVRFGNVLGSRGSVIPLFKEQIERGGPVTVTHPQMTRYFMTIPEAVSLVVHAGGLAKGGEVFVLDMGKPVKIVDLAVDLIRMSGFEPFVDIKIEYTGIRPGEKLYEELLTDEEGVTATSHNRIFIARPAQVDLMELEFQLRVLEKTAVSDGDGDHVCSLLRRMVPGYTRLAQVK